ncbi:hypothetical protein FB451DRAFT_1365908 [Mycena latifolia]|nr:hypothetical protein FB451DRAFT_1365908 [Mycena latifolia]
MTCFEYQGGKRSAERRQILVQNIEDRGEARLPESRDTVRVAGRVPSMASFTSEPDVRRAWIQVSHHSCRATSPVRLTTFASVWMLLSLRSPISKAVLDLLKLENERRLRSKTAVILKGVLSALPRMPSEILLEIFLLCHDDSLSTSSSILDPRQAPMLLCHVSSRWRQTKAAGQQMLARSRTLPLYVKITTHSPDSGVGPAEEYVVDLRPAHLEIMISPSDLVVAAILAFFQDAPQLQTMSLQARSGPIDSLSLTPLPLSQFTRLTLAIPIDFHDARNILAQYHVIQECTLEELVNSGYFEPSRSGFFEAFSLPNLLYLNISGGYVAPDSLHSLCDQSQFSLAELELQFIDLSAEDFMLLLRRLPTLQTLNLHYCSVEAELYKAFTYNPGVPVPSIVLPQLRSLTIGDSRPEMDGRAVANMAKSICAHAGCRNAAFLALVEVDLGLNPCFLNEKAKARLKVACATGIVKCLDLD